MIAVADWRPVGVPGLEATASAAVRAEGSTLVVAGPGTGKTELLGQKAAFLLQTDTCRSPRRILAISFKRDAATNLRDRVERRCGAALARRLDSMTFDAFAKQLLDRFWRALPPHLTFQGPYGIAPFIKRLEFEDLRQNAADGLTENGHPAQWAAALVGKTLDARQIHAVNQNDFNASVQGMRLHPLQISSYGQFLQLVQLRASLKYATPQFGFPMISLLARAIIHESPPIRRAICATYSHVFLDEFQDTTSIQYGLIDEIFKGSSAKLTAVGDDKQRIMGWAGAKSDVFATFEADFLAAETTSGRVSLTQNYRSNARIVEVLNTLKSNLAPHEPDFVAAREAPSLPADEICAILVAKDESDEASAVADHVARAITAGTSPRDIGLLVKQKAVDWEGRLGPAFLARGIALRNEDRDVGGASIQDLMTETYSRILMDMLELLTRRHGGALWSTTVGHLASVRGLVIDDDTTIENELAVELDRFHRDNRMSGSESATPADVTAKVAAIESFLGLPALRAAAPQYSSEDFFDRIRRATVSFLSEIAAKGVPWSKLLETSRGINEVPLLTITKSKGLEYDLVILLGLNDQEWWSFDKDPGEGHSNFFVAASRARERLLMTRQGRDRNSKIRSIFDLLAAAGVPQVAA
ncbi:ATP-dependent helicase [uncultured Brevundimonas sp.]|uniref:UvrD-helicase domain-containing protein n=1 Tax=uncultured Brevundimonas sp. TaxID=213418 RepID=UPI0025F0EF00|nr:ATP-dependent helicase [uncultured Brevundimonas sp.]